MIHNWQNIKLVSIYSKSVNHENSKCLHFASVQMKKIVQNRPFFLSFQTECENESYLTQWHTKGFHNIKLVSLYSKSVSCGNSKCLHFASVQMKHIVQNRPFFLSFQTEWKNKSYLTQWHTKGFQNIKLVSIYSKSVSHENFKCLHFVSVQVKHIVQNRQFSSLTRKGWKMSHIPYNGIPKAFRMSNWFAFIQSQWATKFQMSSFCVSAGSSFCVSARFALCVSLVLMCKMKTFGIFTAHWFWIKGN